MRLLIAVKQKHYPPQIPPHWGCRCRVVGVERPEDASTLGGEPDKALPEGWQAVDAEHKDPALLAQGWNFAPGANVDTALRELVEKKLIDYPPAIAKALSRDLNRYLSAEHPPALFAEAVLADRQLTHDQWLGFPDNFDRIQRDTGQDVKGYIGILPAQAPRHVMNSHQYDGKGQRPVTPEDYNSAWTVLNEADDIRAGSNDGHNHLETIVAVKMMGGEKWRAVYEIRPGRKTRLLALVSLVIKTAH